MAKFDDAAAGYDQEFTHSPIGIFQRKAVWNYLNKVLPKRPLNILELNAGTGEDAIALAKKGHRVVCTDASEKMLQIAEQKARSEGLSHLITCKKLDFNDLEGFQIDYQFDLIFSNFGGINCIDEKSIELLSRTCHKWLLPDGELIWVMLGKYCIWEWFYFFFKGEFRKGERRWTKQKVEVNVNGNGVSTWYYSNSELEGILKNNFKKIASKAIGTFVPPSYLNPRFKKGSNVLKTLDILDDEIGSSSVFSDLSDHYLIHFSKK